ncbi:hypothetical protein [Streptomyces sp. NPDC051561]|uniref:hypothetical protein n=1 Tax=Streptomyces sp. NPDC051561 TaxID=3365658 RepID=UPI00378C9A2B
MLIEAVVVVAATATVQVAWLEKYNVPPDEIALDFDDAFRLAAHLVDEGQLSPVALPHLQMIDDVFSEMAQAAGMDPWTRSALHTEAGWDRARQAARKVLTAEGEGDAPLPDICIIR